MKQAFARRPTPRLRCNARWRACALVLLTLLGGARADEPSEYELKAAFLYNFALFTDWPNKVPEVITLCIYGEDPFGESINALRGRLIGQRTLALRRKSGSDSLQACQLVFIAASAIKKLPQLLDAIRESPVLTVADSPDAAHMGVMLNMAVVQGGIRFMVNLRSVRAADLRISSKLLSLATEVIQ
jgi:hypothetical protein